MIRARHFAFVAFLFLSLVNARAEPCAVCSKEIMGDTIYIFTHKVTNEKKHICSDCSLLQEVCFVCGMPVREHFVKLSDGRVLCARDARNAVLDATEARKIFYAVSDDLDRLFSRFTSFPTNIDVHIVDRVSLLALFKVPGNDFKCPDVLGYFQAKTNRHKLQFEISLMSALSRAELKATCAHELSHAWVAQNVSAHRKEELDQDAEEGFCELISYLLMDSENEQAQKKVILESTYTRGQIDLFVAAERAHGLNDVLDWMKWGTDSSLDPEEPNRIRVVAIPKEKTTSPSNTLVFAEARVVVPDVLTLKGISGVKGRALALINDQTLAVGESGKVRVGTTNVLVRCIEIRNDSVLIQIGESKEQRELSLRKEK
jgi:hypothetical protein